MRVEEHQHEIDVEREDQVAILESGAAPDAARASEVDTSVAHFFELSAVIEALLHGDEIDVSALAVGEHERAAIDYLVAAITGRDHGRFVYAEDRLTMLNQALAVLQPVLAVGAVMSEIDAVDRYHALVTDVGELRDALDALSDAQEEVFAQDHPPPLARDEDDTPPADAGGDEPRPTTLVGDPEAVIVEQPTTLVGGPEALLEERPTTLVGSPEVVLEERPTTLLGGPEDAPEVSIEERASTLYDEAPIAPDAPAPDAPAKRPRTPKR
ncbi:MAG: hypothetical protein K8W52_39525 [Deltaproteobacteria bacterium]|nr:hypothetical protein [Deltaproteobacteria bacterium]